MGHGLTQTTDGNITLLWYLGDIVESPKQNKLPEVRAHWQQLPLKREKQLVDILAFLAGSRDD